MNISESVKYIGVDDTTIDLFESQYVVPEGVSYNSYVILDEKIAIMDTVDKRGMKEWEDNLLKTLDGKKADYVIVQHMEPDHAATMAEVVLRYPKVRIVCNEKIKNMIAQFFDFDFTDRFHLVKEGDTLEIGSRRFIFVMAPMVHWPEVMTAYEETEKILFSADAFGRFGSLERTARAPWVPQARRYYYNIIGKYGAQVQALLKKTSALEIQTICPLHGPVLTEGLEECLRLYDLWSQWEPEESESILIAHASIHGNTAHAAKTLKGKLEKKGVQVSICDLTVTDLSYAVASAFYCGKLVLASATYDGGLFPPMREFLEHLRTKGFRNRRVGLIEDGSWAPDAARLMRTKLEEMKDIHLYETVVSLRSALNQTSEVQMDALVAELCAG